MRSGSLWRMGRRLKSGPRPDFRDGPSGVSIFFHLSLIPNYNQQVKSFLLSGFDAEDSQLRQICAECSNHASSCNIFLQVPAQSDRIGAFAGRKWFSTLTSGWGSLRLSRRR